MDTLPTQHLREPALVELNAVNAGMGDLVGGKAANLGELLGADAAVPPGFCITTHAYADACQSIPGFDDLVEQLAIADHAEIPALARQMRDQLHLVSVPSDLTTAIKAAYARLGSDAAVAVRSSATAEDLPHASFAGQQDTYLNVVGTEALLEAVTRCWGSLWTDRAVFYRASNNIDHRKVRLAVVVQRMVDATASGVLFTANPVTGRRDEAVIDANAGLGESVVSGAVNPDHFVIDTATGVITERSAGDKEFSIWSKPGGGTEKRAGTGEVSLTDSQVRELAARGHDIQQHYGFPQDIEWALDGGGKLWLTQSRPITTLFPVPRKDTGDLRVYLSVNVAQGVYRPLTPMGASIMQFAAGAFAANLGFPPETRFSGPPAMLNARGWLFLDLTPLSRNTWGRRIVPRMLTMMEARASQIFRWLLGDPRLAVTPGATRATLRVLARVLRKTKFPLRIARAWLRPSHARADAFQVAEDIRADLAATRPSTPRARLAAAQRGFLDVTAPRLFKLVPTLMGGILLSRLLPKILGKHVTAEEVQVVLRGIPHNVTTEMDLELWRIAQDAANIPGAATMFAEASTQELVSRYRHGTLPEPLQQELTLFLRRHGHRAVAEIDAGMPRWADNPAPILDTLANYFSTTISGHSAQERYAQGVDEAEDMVRRIIARLRRTNPLHAWVAKLAMHRVRQLVGLREMPKYCIVLTIANARRQLLEVGEDLAAQQLLQAADDVLFLRFSEIHEAVDGKDFRALVKERREQHELELRRKHIPRMLLSDGTEPETLLPRPDTDGALAGVSASAGSVTGIAKVVLDPDGARLAPGEILVAPSTDPGWTPLFLTAGGLVMEMGGPNSHGATVAREYGIPAVVGVPGATQHITTGQRITVNGSAGTVELR